MVYLAVITLLLLLIAAYYFAKKINAGDILEREAVIVDKWMESSGQDSDTGYHVVFQLSGSQEEIAFETDAAVYSMNPGTRGMLSYRKGEFKGFVPSGQSKFQ